MQASSTAVAETVLEEFDAAWRDDTPIFGCCRKAVETAVEEVDLASVATLDATARVTAMREAVDAQLPDHLSSHRCCAGHLADLAFDLPGLLAPVVDADGTG